MVLARTAMRCTSLVPSLMLVLLPALVWTASIVAALPVAVRDKVAVVTLNRPEHRNALHIDAHHELENLWAGIAQDEAVKAIVLTGAGKTFSAGGDIKSMVARHGTVEGLKYTLNIPAATKRLLQNILDVPQPIIAAVNGDAVGLGATLVLFSDISIMNEGAKFGDTHTKVGLVAGDGGAREQDLCAGEIVRGEGLEQRFRDVFGGGQVHLDVKLLDGLARGRADGAHLRFELAQIVQPVEEETHAVGAGEDEPVVFGEIGRAHV